MDSNIKNISKKFTGNKDIDNKILQDLDDKSLSQICQVNKYIYNLCKEEQFWTNRFVRKSIKIAHSEDYSGGVQGSYPVNGDYGYYEQLNWAAKFYVDAQLLELDLANGK